MTSKRTAHYNSNGTSLAESRRNSTKLQNLAVGAVLYTHAAIVKWTFACCVSDVLRADRKPLVNAGVDIVIDTLHGHTQGVVNVLKEVKKAST